MMKTLLFDFDGVLADSLDAVLRVLNRLAPEFGYPSIEKKDLPDWKHLSTREIIQQSGIPVRKLPAWLKKFKQELAHEVPEMKPFPGLEESLVRLRKEGGGRIGILSSNSEENVAHFLKSNGWESYIDFIYSSSTLFGKSRILNKILKNEGISPDNALYIGDETRDIEAAKKSRVRVVAVTWGFNSRESLIKAQPDFIIDRPEELANVIRKAD